MSGVPENGWYAVLDGEQSGPMELSVLLGAVSEGRADGATFVWRPGYPEWRRAGEVEGLGELINAAVAEGSATTVSAPDVAVSRDAGYSDEMRKTVAVDMDAVVRAAEGQKSTEETPTETSEPAASSASMDTLFSDDPTPSTGDTGGGFFDVPEEQSESDKVMLYQRRDTSVLFSLDDFGKGGSAGGDSKQEVFAERTAESGLIDIRAVARKTAAPSDSGGGLFENSPTQVAASTDFSTRMSTRTEPLIMARKRKAGIPVWAVLVGGLCVATLGAMGALYFGGDTGEEPVPAVPVAVPQTPVKVAAAEKVAEEAVPAAPKEVIEEKAPTPKAVEEKASEVNTDEVDEAASVAADTEPEAVDEGGAEKSGEAVAVVKTPKPKAPKKKVASAAVKKKQTKKKAKAAKAPAKKPAPKKKAPAPKPAPKKADPPPAKSAEANQATALLNSLGSGGGGGKAAAAPVSSGSGKKKLSKADIRKAIKKHTKSVIGCYNASGQAGGSGPVIVTAKLKVASSGGVSSVSVLGALGSGAVGSCISSKLKTAKFPAFDDGPQTVSMTFRVR